MQDPALFPFIDIAMRVIAVLALGMVPFMIPPDSIRRLDRRWRVLRDKLSLRASPVSLGRD